MSKNYELENKLKFHDLIEKARNKAIYSTYLDYYKDKFTRDPTSMEEITLIPVENDLKLFCMAKNRGISYKYLLITVNFKPEIEWDDDLKKKILKFWKKKWITKSVSCIEFRTIDGTGMHMHSKVWLKEGKKWTDCKREVYNTFKEYVGNKQHVNIVGTYRDGAFDDYVNGIKGGQKKVNYAADLAFRKNLGIPHPLELLKHL